MEVETGDVLCHRCEGPALLSVLVPHRMQLPSGGEATGRRTVVLCPRCDRDDPAAQGVLAFFTVHERITHETVESAGAVLREWITHVTEHPPVYTDEEMDEDIRRWEAGEM